ncbi:methyltransferase domain-containing protein [Archangium violaceum]|uniref:class I SAM-dependent methyltransferase n=1 Tax=Archangium violaceum TaxID=83451 RepID=UPI00193B8D89|nr:class I SAM-dependent methyltransferase [Archangium violaceum]QRK07647.1 methyltransferase domain-containing protein [Archangium violaceum]
MNITLSPQDYATAFHLLAKTARHHENIGQWVERNLLSRMPERPSLLDVGAGPGTVAQRLAPHFGSLTLLEPNRNQLSAFEHPGARLFHTDLAGYQSSEQYDLVLCSHVLYHVPLADWGRFVDQLLARVRPGGYCLIVLGAARGQSYELHRDFTQTVISSEQLHAVLKGKQLSYEVAETLNGFSATSFEEMYTLCRFFVFEDCYTPEQLAALSEDEKRALDARIREHAERYREPDGVYRLTQDEDLILIPKP